ncbi:MAG: Lysophospholipase [Herbinix sp.]|jgi:lysophospholipase|nr:Lysophospholipase [Herbinix sp.]
MKENMNMTGYEKMFLGEEDYMNKMVHIVRPLLENNRKTGYFTSFDGTRIFYEYYDHPQEKAAIVMSHGFCEFTKKFEEVIYYFFQAGYSVYICDHRGHGYSQRSVQDRSKVYLHSYNEYVLDFHDLIINIILKDAVHRKLVLYAHSMGGAIAALYLEQYPEVFLCAILSSPMLEIDFGKNPESMVRLVMLYKKLTHSDEDYVSGHGAFDGIAQFESSSCLSEARYQDIFTKRLQDKNYQTYGASCAWTLASIRAVRKLNRDAKLVKTPVLLFQAGSDTTVKPCGQKRFAKKSKNTRMVVIPASKHEIYNGDSEIRKEYYHKIFAFLDEILSP